MTFQLFEAFPTQEVAREYLESRFWPDGPKCPVCQSLNRITVRSGGYFRCNACSEDFTIRTGTIFERSHVPLNKWVYSMYLLVTARKGISSLQLGKEIGVTQKTAWFILGRLREACGGDLEPLRGTTEVLDKMADTVLAYRPKPKSAPAKKRELKRKKATARASL
jgi:transposase-like protein